MKSFQENPGNHPLKIICKEEKVLIWAEGKFWRRFRQLPPAQSLRRGGALG
jgi:hypothetical protein